MARLAELSTSDQVKVISAHAGRALTFDSLDLCANLARNTGNWKVCVTSIHERNMSMLGKTRQGYEPAVYVKGFHEVVVNNEYATFKSGKRVHARELCKRGYKYFPHNLSEQLS